MRSLGAKVPKDKGENYRKVFAGAQLINRDLMIKRNDRFLFIPLLSHPESKPDLRDKTWLNDIEFKKYDFERYPKRITDYKTLVILPPKLCQLLPSSYDIIGSIVLVKIPNELIQYSRAIGDSILKVNKNLKTVVLNKGVKGPLRVRELEIIAGEDNTETIQKEFGIRLMMDVTKVYFSPRLSDEHWRIAKLVQPGEIVLDMFAGIGPFSIMIARYSKAHAIYAIDLNKFAIEYLVRNIDLNKVSNIFPLEGDAKNVINKVPDVNRIIMNLPTNGKKYLPVAFSKLKNKGYIHYHEMLKKPEFDQRKKWLEETVVEFGFKALSSTGHNLGSYSPDIYHFCFDLELERK